MSTENIDLQDKPPKPKELTTDEAIASYTDTQAAVPRGGTPIAAGLDTEKYAALSLNPTAKTAKDAVINAAFWVDWQITSTIDLDEHPELTEFDSNLIEFIKKNLHHLDYESFNNVIVCLLDKAVTYGFVIAEQLWESVEGMWELVSIKPKPSFEFDVNMDNGDNIESLAYIPEDINLNPEKFVIGTYPWLADGNPYGLSEFEVLEGTITQLAELETYFTQGIANTMNRTCIHSYDYLGMSETLRNARLKAVSDGMTSGGGLIQLPADLNEERAALNKLDEFEVLEAFASEDALPALENRINELRAIINRYFGIPDDLGNTTTNVGSNAKAQTEFNFFSAKAFSWRDWIQQVINRQIISRIVAYNYEDDELPDNYTTPAFTWQTFEEDELGTRGEAVANLVTNGIITSAEARAELGFSMIDESELQTEEQQTEEGTPDEMV